MAEVSADSQGQMAEELEAKQRRIQKGILKWVLIMGAISVVGKFLLTEIVGLPSLIALGLSKFFALLVAYRFFPEPRPHFTKYTVTLGSILISWYLTGYLAIPYLESFLPPVLAYGIPIISYTLLFGVIIYLAARYSRNQKNS